MRSYPSKLLLFGEHILLLGSTALALPLPVFHGKWMENGGVTDLELQDKLLQFAKSASLMSIENMDAQAFFEDLQNGLRFDSNIPVGYGLGSSGALCAAVYDRYCRLKTADLQALKTVFARMESFFHGASSGIDPLTSYVGKPLLIRHKSDIAIVEMAPWEQPPVVFLIDSALPRQTEPLVRWFLEKREQTPFARELEMTYLPAHEAMVQAWLDANAELFWPNLQQVSRYQLEHFEPMIPDTLRSIWMDSLDKQHITFKICGAGGGGFMLGFSRSIEPVLTLADQYNIVLPFTEMP